MKRIIVIGCPGSGKSTFARALQTRTGLPLHYLDLLYWNADRTTVARDAFRARLNEILLQEEWIIDGNYSSTMELRIQACDTIFFLDYATEVCLAGILSRRGKARPDMPWVEIDEDTEFTEYVRDFQANSRPQILSLLDRYADREIHVLKTREEADAYLSAFY